jgi:hypothetical protein
MRRGAAKLSNSQKGYRESKKVEIHTAQKRQKYNDKNN